MFPLQGILAVANVATTPDWIFQIMDSILQAYKSLWIENPHLGDHDYIVEDENFYRRFKYLQMFKELFLKPPDNIRLWGSILDRLYISHGIWVLRLLGDVLHFAINYYHSEFKLHCIETIGIIWSTSTLSSQEQPSSEMDELTWLIVILQGCAAHPASKTTLLHLIEDPTFYLPNRKLALFVLSLFNSEIVDSLLPLYKWHPNEMREVAARILGILHSSQSVPSLIETMRDEDPKLRAQCVWALGEIKDPRALDPLLRLLNNPDLDVQLKVIEALGKLGDSRAIPPLLEKWENLKAQLTEIGAHYLLMMSEWQVKRVTNWRQTTDTVQEALQKLGVDIPPLTEKDAVKKHGFTIS